MMHVCVGERPVGTGNGLSHDRSQAIALTMLNYCQLNHLYVMSPDNVDMRFKQCAFYGKRCQYVISRGNLQPVDSISDWLVGYPWVDPGSY